MHKTTATIALAACLALPGAHGADGAAGEARAAAQRQLGAGDHAGAEAAFSALLAANPRDLDALVGRANARAFARRYGAAQEDYAAALAIAPDHLPALIGSGYAHAWAGRHDLAETRFAQANRIDPDNLDAAKGAAWVALWRGDPALALARFEGLLARAPDLEEARRGRDQARAARAAGAATESATPAPSLAAAGASGLPRYEATVFFGHSELPQGLSENGLRFAELAFRPHERLRLHYRHDEGMSRDNVAFVRSSRNVPLRAAGAFWQWHERYATSFEVGRRRFPDGVTQRIYQIEQLVLLPGGYTAKAGGWSGPRSDDRREWSVHAGAGIPVGQRWRIEPTAFYSRSGSPGEREWRLLLAAGYDLGSGWELGGGGAWGETTTQADTRAIREGFLRATWKANDALRVHGFARRETVRDGDDITVLSLGLSYAWR